MKAVAVLGLAALLPAAACAGEPTGSRQEDRERMLAAVAADARATGPETGRAELSPEVLAALGRVPRHRFVPAALASSAYDNRPLPIGSGQTISQPFIVALMTDLVDPEADDRVLEVGTGSGYQAAVLAELVDHVYTVEIVPELAREAEARLERLGYDNVTVHLGDGGFGWAEHAPYDAIVVTAAAPHVPSALVEQLASGGRMVLPVGEPGGFQTLVLVARGSAGEVTQERILGVTFVPLTGDEGR